MADTKMAKKAFRKEIMELIISFCNIFDRSGSNTEYYNEYFNTLSDDEFIKEIKSVLDDPKKYFTMQIHPFKRSGEPRFQDFTKLAKLVNVELEEYVALPYMNEHTKNMKIPITPTKIVVGLLHIKRLQQILKKKNHMASGIDIRDPRKGTVKSEDKGARTTDADMYALSILGAHPVMQELFGPRADGMKRKDSFYKKIRDGESLPRLSDLPQDPQDHTALNTLDVYFLGAGISTDLIRKGLLLEITKRDLARQATKRE